MSARRVTAGFIPELDGLRGIAILIVMVHRFWPRATSGLAADTAGAGWIGVDLFFVISGFLIAGILLDTKGDTGYFRNFYARRVLRIFPLYYLFVIGMFVAFAGNAAFREHAGSPVWYLAHLGNVPEGVLGLDVPYVLAPVWSLAIEEQFYLTFPLLVYLLDRRQLTIALIAMVIAAPILRAATMLAWPEHERVQYLFTLCRLDTIAVGCLLAIVVRGVDLERWHERAVRVALVSVPLVLVLSIASRLDRTSEFDRVFGYSVVAVGCVSIVALVILARGQASTALLRLPWLRYFGKLCFGLYLLHRPADVIVRAAADRLGVSGDLWLMPAKIALALVLATVSWRLIERPFLALKDRFASARHPHAPVQSAPAGGRTGIVGRTLRQLGVLSLVVIAAACAPREPGAATPDLPASDGGADGDRDAVSIDASSNDASSNDASMNDASTDGPVDAAAPLEAVVLYPEGARHSPIPASLVGRLQAVAASEARVQRVFAKVGDSITASPDFVSCFDGGVVDLGANGHLAGTLTFFRAGNAAGTSPYLRTSYAAVGGSTAADAMTGAPHPLEREVEAIHPRFATVLFGTNEARYDWTLDAFATRYWPLVDALIERGVVPILSTIPPNPGYPAADARIPTFNRVVRAIAQGRGVPLVDFHRELESLPGRGISSDGLHPSTAPAGACVLTAAGLQYNMRNLLTLEALQRARAAVVQGVALDPDVATRSGSGSVADPFTGTLPLADLGDTRAGDAQLASYACGGPATSGHERVYRLDLASRVTLDAHVISSAGADVDVLILEGAATGAACVARGDKTASATVGPGPVFIVVDARDPASDGEFVLVAAAR